MHNPCKEFGRKHVLVIGDVMLDSFVYGTVDRISPESASPIMRGSREDRMIGGAANVARGVAALGAHAMLLTVTGDDKWASQIARECAAFNIELKSFRDTSRQTTRKVRFVSEEHHSHLMRLDYEDTHGLSVGIEHAVTEDALELLKRADCVILSDYAKGVLTPRLIRMVIDQANRYGLPILVDPKAANPNIYTGCTIIKPNRNELRKTCKTEQDYIEAVTTYGAMLKAEGVLVTRGDQGMTLYRAAMPAIHIPAHRVRVADVSGAGDTVLATLGVCLACGIEMPDAMKFANDAAAIAVTKVGTASVTRDELLAPKGKIVSAYDLSLLDQRLGEWRHAGYRVGFTNGCFDLIHPGHIKLLTEARASCERLIVGLNTDSSVRYLKGNSRPIQKWHERADVLASIEGVDLVVGFTADTPYSLVERIMPAVIIKGSDYRPEDVCGHEFAEVKIVESLPGVSTTSIIERGRAHVA